MAESIGVYVGKRLLALREQRGITQAELAQAAGVPQGNISRLERGGADDLQVSTLLGLATALRVKPVQLLPEGKAPGARAATPRERRRRPKPAGDDTEHGGFCAACGMGDGMHRLECSVIDADVAHDPVAQANLARGRLLTQKLLEIAGKRGSHG